MVLYRGFEPFFCVCVFLNDRSKSVKAEDEKYFDSEEAENGELWNSALLWGLVLCWWCRSTLHTVLKCSKPPFFLSASLRTIISLHFLLILMKF